MSDKNKSLPLDAALAHVDSDRRRFLGMLLVGVAAVPLLASEDLNAEDKAHFPKADEGKFSKTQAAKGGPNNAIKLDDQKTQSIKFFDKTNSGKSQQIKNSNSTIKDGTAIKGENSAIKLNNGAAIKGGNSTIKLNNGTAIKGETKPAPR